MVQSLADKENEDESSNLLVEEQRQASINKWREIFHGSNKRKQDQLLLEAVNAVAEGTIQADCPARPTKALKKATGNEVVPVASMIILATHGLSTYFFLVTYGRSSLY